MRNIFTALLCALIFVAGINYQAIADYAATAGSGLIFRAFDATHGGTSLCAAANTQCQGSVPITSAGAEILPATAANQVLELAAIQAPPGLGTSGGWTPVGKIAVTNSSVTVKGSAGQLGWVQCDNNNAAWTYVQLFDATSPSVGTNVGFIPLAPSLPGGMTISLVGIQFSNSIKVAATTTPNGSSAPGTNTINCTFGYN